MVFSFVGLGFALLINLQKRKKAEGIIPPASSFSGQLWYLHMQTG
jgi:hypothetical protein